MVGLCKFGMPAVYNYPYETSIATLMQSNNLSEGFMHLNSKQPKQHVTFHLED